MRTNPNRSLIPTLLLTAPNALTKPTIMRLSISKMTNSLPMTTITDSQLFPSQSKARNLWIKRLAKWRTDRKSLRRRLSNVSRRSRTMPKLYTCISRNCNKARLKRVRNFKPRKIRSCYLKMLPQLLVERTLLNKVYKTW